MNPTTLYNPNTGITATPTAGVTPAQTAAAISGGFSPAPSYSRSVPALSVGGQSPVYVPPTPTPSFTSSGISGGATASLDAHQVALDQQLADKEAAAKQAKDQSKADLTGAMQQYLNVQSSRPTVEAGLHVDELKTLANDSFTALQASKRAQEVELKDLDSQGMTDAGRAAAARDINRKYAFEQADLSISLDVANRNYTSAQSTADKKIEMQLEPLKTLIDFQTTFYNENKADLTKNEDRQFQSLLTNNTRQYDEQQTMLKNISAVQLEAAKNGAPASVIRAIGSTGNQASAIIAAGNYIDSKTSVSGQSNFVDIMQAAIDQGASPEKAARAAAAVSEASGIQVDQATLSRWTQQAKGLKVTPVPTASTATASTVKPYQDPRGFFERLGSGASTIAPAIGQATSDYTASVFKYLFGK